MFEPGDEVWVRAEVEAAYGVCCVNEDIQVNVGGTRLWVPITDIRPSPPPDLRALVKKLHEQAVGPVHGILSNSDPPYRCAVCSARWVGEEQHDEDCALAALVAAYKETDE